MKNASIKKKILDFSNENNSLNKKVKCHEIENRSYIIKSIRLKKNLSISFEHESLAIGDLTKENDALKKKSDELNDIVLKFTNGPKNLEKLFGF